MNANPELDPAALVRLERLGGPEFVAKMIALFLDYAGGKVTEARAACAAGNLEGVAAAVHPIKSSAGNVGATRLQELASEVETLAKQGDTTRMGAVLRDMERAFETVKPELEQKKNPVKPPT